MSNILAIGSGPLIEDGVRVLGAHCLRTWNLAKALADDGHRVELFTIPIFQAREAAVTGVAEHTYRGLAYRAFLNGDETHNLEVLESFCTRFKPDCIVGINSGPAALAARLEWAAPLWADLFGHVMGEGQGKAFAIGANTHLHYFWDLEEAVLRRADRFSASSRRQMHALYGELGAVGRLNRHTFQYEFAAFMPPAFDPFHAEEFLPEPSPLLAAIPDDAFVVLWSGGFNTWTNVDVLAAALERAMAANANLHFVSTGGALFGYDELTYPRFEALLAQSAHRERCHLLGWIDAAQLPAIYARSDLALCVDSCNLETRFGTRTRIMNLMAAGVPVAATRGSEIVEDLEAAKCLIACAPDDSEALAGAILSAARDTAALSALAQRGRGHVLEHYHFERNTEPLRQWAKAPSFAPDNAAKLERFPHAARPLAHALSPLEARGLPHAQHAHEAGFAERLLGSRRWQSLRRAWQGMAWANRRIEPVQELRLAIAVLDAQGPPEAAVLKAHERIVLGPDPHLHARSENVIRSVAQAASATPIRLLSSGQAPPRLEKLCCRLLDERLPGPLEVALEARGLEATQNALAGRPAAWRDMIYSLALLKGLAPLYPGCFTLVARVELRRENWREMDKLVPLLAGYFASQIEFMLPPNKALYPPPGAWNDLLKLARAIDQAQGRHRLPNYRRLRREMAQA